MTTTIVAANGLSQPAGVESGYAWLRLFASLLIGTIGGVALWSSAVVLPAVQAEFGVVRADASLPYTAVMLGFVIGGPAMGWLADRFGIAVPVAAGAIILGIGFATAAGATGIYRFTLAHALIGLGGSCSFGPLIADTSHWFERRRGIAVAICASGSYLAGTVWPLIIQPLASSLGWRNTYLGVAVFCVAAMPTLLLALRRPTPTANDALRERLNAAGDVPTAAIAPGQLQSLLMLAGLFCCMAMAMPQVHIVAYCTDLGYGGANGARMLSLMLGTGVISRLAFGLAADRIGPLRALLLSSSLQALCLLLYLASDGLWSLYTVTALFGLVQGGIVPTYTVIVRENFPASEAGARVGLVLSSTLAGMAVGGWMSGAIFDATLSYRAAFLNGFVWNLANIAIALWLLWRLPPRPQLRPSPVPG